MIPAQNLHCTFKYGMQALLLGLCIGGCSGGGGGGGSGGSDTVPPVNTSVTLTANPQTIGSGAAATLTWSTTNADSCTASGSWSGSRPTSGTESTGMLDATSVFTLTCSGQGSSASNSTTVTVTPANPPRGSYSTNFDLTENPISEGGVWSRANNSFTNVRTANGIAFGTNGITNTFDDSYALLAGFGPDQTAEAVVMRSAGLNTAVTHEVELLLRFSDDNNSASGYECLFAFFGGVQIVRWDGTQGFMVLNSLQGSESLGRQLTSGDVVSASIIGNVITLFINGNLVAQTTDATYATGQPGIGFFTRPGGNSADLGLTSYSVTSN